MKLLSRIFVAIALCFLVAVFSGCADESSGESTSHTGGPGMINSDDSDGSDDPLPQPDDAGIVLTANPETVVEESVSIISAIVTGDDGEVVEGALVTFVVDNENYGTVNPITATTNATGLATTDFTTTIQPGEVKISASTDDTKSASPVILTIVTPSNSTIGSLELTAGASELVAGCVATIGVRAKVRDLDGNPVEGVDVVFTPTQGTIVTPLVATDSAGIADALYNVPTTSGNVDVIASVGGFSKIVSLSFIPGSADGGNSSVTATPSTVPADGVSESIVYVVLADSNNNLVANGTDVTLIATAGTISSANPAKTVSGRASFTLQATASEATANLMVQEVSDTPACNVIFGVSSDGYPASIELSAGTNQISVAGVGQNENTTISVRVLDSSGEVIDESEYFQNNLRVSFISRPNGGEYVSGTDCDGTVQDTRETGSMVVKTNNGVITLGLQAGTLPGVVEVLVEALCDETGAFLDTPVTASIPQLAIASGSPHNITLSQSHLNAIVDMNTLPAPETKPGFYRRSGSISVTDRYGNNVPDGTAVSLGLVDSLIAMGNNGVIAKDSANLTASGAGFDTAFITRDDPQRLIEENDRVLLLNAEQADKSRVVDIAPESETTIKTNMNYTADKSSLQYVVGSNLLGAFISGADEDGNKIPGTAITKDGLANFWVTYPANPDKILTGCYGYSSSDPTSYDDRDKRRDKPTSAQVYVVASAGDGVTTIDQGRFGFSPIAGFTLTASAEEISGTDTVELELRDGGDEVLLPYYDISRTVKIDSINDVNECSDSTKTTEATCVAPAIWTGKSDFDVVVNIDDNSTCTDCTDENGFTDATITVTGVNDHSGSKATVTFKAGDGTTTVKVEIP